MTVLNVSTAQKAHNNEKEIFSQCVTKVPMIICRSYFLSELLEDIDQLQSCLHIACRRGHTNVVIYWIQEIRTFLGENLPEFNFSSQYDFVGAARRGKWLIKCNCKFWILYLIQ